MKRIPLPKRFHKGIDNGKLVAHEFVAFLVDECGATNTSGKALYDTPLKALTMDGFPITRCEIDKYKYEACIMLG